MNVKNKHKAKSIIGCVIFMLILADIFSKTTWVLRGNNKEARMDIVGFKNQGDIDVVLYGGSTLLRYYSPLNAWEQSGMVAYNYATSAAKVDIVKEYIEDSRMTNDALLYIIDIRTYPMLAATIDDSSIRNWSDSLPVFSLTRWKGITSFLFTRNWKEADIPSFYFDIIKYHSNTDSLGNPSQWQYMDSDNVYNIDKGYAPTLVSVPFDTPAIVQERGELTDQQEKALNELLDYCTREKLQVLFIVPPYYISESDWKTLNTCGDMIQSRGYDYINFNMFYDDIGLDFERDFSDVNHVNYIGSIKYTEYLTNYIKSNYEIPDHRGEEYYAQWNEDYAALAANEIKWYEELTDTIRSHTKAKTLGRSLQLEDDFDTWYQNIQNDNFTVIIKKNGAVAYDNNHPSFDRFISKYELDMSQEHYIGVWSEDKMVFSANDEEPAEIELGLDQGRGTDQCIIINGGNSQFTINGMDYDRTAQGVQVLVYDHNYKKVLDNVTIQINAEGDVILNRE